MKYNAIQTSELVYLDTDLKFEVKRIFILSRKLKKYGFTELMKEIYGFNKKNGVDTHLIAMKFGKVELDSKKKINKLEVLNSATLEDETEWHVNPLVSKEFAVLERLADPVILVMSDKKQMKYRISYYIELVKSGVSGDAALNIIFS